MATKETKGTRLAAQERAIFKLFSLGVSTNRDDWLYDRDHKALERKVRHLIKTYDVIPATVKKLCDVRDNPKLSGTTHNVFGIQTGVAVSFLVKRRKTTGSRIHYGRRPEFETREEKLVFLHSADLERAAPESFMTCIRASFAGPRTGSGMTGSLRS